MQFFALGLSMVFLLFMLHAPPITRSLRSLRSSIANFINFLFFFVSFVSPRGLLGLLTQSIDGSWTQTRSFKGFWLATQQSNAKHSSNARFYGRFDVLAAFRRFSKGSQSCQQCCMLRQARREPPFVLLIYFFQYVSQGLRVFVIVGFQSYKFTNSSQAQ